MKLKADDIATFLINNPDFFLQHSSLLEKLQIPHQSKGQISLVEAQLQRHREKISELESLIDYLKNLLNYNETILKQMLNILQQLLICSNIKELQKIIQIYGHEMKFKRAALFLIKQSWFDNPDITSESWLDRQAFEIIRLEKFGLSKSYLGQLTGREQSLLFLPAELPIGSVAIKLIKANPQNRDNYDSILLFADHSNLRFNKRQSTYMLEYFSLLIQYFLPRILSPKD